MAIKRGGAIKGAKKAQFTESSVGKEISKAFVDHLNAYHSLNVYDDIPIEELLLEQKRKEIESKKNRTFFPFPPKGSMQFSPSSANACMRQLFYKANRFKKDDLTKYPYQKRWADNGSAIHERVQRDLLYAEKKLKDPLFTVQKTEDGMPMWESNIRKQIKIEHNGETFYLFGMNDGLLKYEPLGIDIGFEFKTKSTTIAALGNYKMKGPSEDHLAQQISYKLLYDIDNFLIVYESLAKDGWFKEAGAKPDIRAFHVTIKEEDITKQLDRWAKAARYFRTGEIPPKEPTKCTFCPYKTACARMGDTEIE